MQKAQLPNTHHNSPIITSNKYLSTHNNITICIYIIINKYTFHVHVSYIKTSHSTRTKAGNYKTPRDKQGSTTLPVLKSDSSKIHQAKEADMDDTAMPQV